MVLIDTSIWIEFFKRKPSNDVSELNLLLAERQVATCKLIYAEVCSGQMNSSTQKIVKSAFLAMSFVDPDWNSMETLDALVTIAQDAYRHKVPSCGLIDRMILLCAIKSKVPLWTLDQKLNKLASHVGVDCWLHRKI